MTDYTSQSAEEIIKKVQEFRTQHKIHNLVVTGGEPLLQQKQLIELLSNEMFKDMSIEFETNGSMPLIPEMQNFLKNRQTTSDQKFSVSFNISPKLKDSGNRSYKANIYPNAVLKFVYVSEQTEELIDEFITSHSAQIKDIPIFIMPEGTTVESMSQKYNSALHYCIKKGYRFTPRLHIYLFGNKRAT